MRAVLEAANALIVLGYFYAALAVGPVLPVPLWTKFAATAFFTGCAGTHLDEIVHVRNGDLPADPHMLWIHIPQAIAIWAFVLGFRAALRHINDALEAAGWRNGSP